MWEEFDVGGGVGSTSLALCVQGDRRPCSQLCNYRYMYRSLSERLCSCRYVLNVVFRLPMSHTCFNQLVLPAYRSRKVLKQKLMIALQNAEGFGLE